jgi:hypothetical protein
LVIYQTFRFFGRSVLFDHRGVLADTAAVNEQAEELFFRLVKQLSEKEGVTEQLKAENQMLWVKRMNNIRNRATEIVNAELIYL